MGETSERDSRWLISSKVPVIISARECRTWCIGKQDLENHGPPSPMMFIVVEVVHNRMIRSVVSQGFKLNKGLVWLGFFFPLQYVDYAFVVFMANEFILRLWNAIMLFAICPLFLLTSPALQLIRLEESRQQHEKNIGFLM